MVFQPRSLPGYLVALLLEHCVIRSRTDRLISGLLFLSALCLYILTVTPSIRTMFDDSLEFQYGLYSGAILHPTGYPLYSLLGWLWTHLFPIGEVAYRANLLAAVCGAATLAFLYPAIRAVRCGILPALAAVLLFAISPEFWQYATIAEVYSLNTLVLAATLYMAIRTGERVLIEKRYPQRDLLVFAFITGLGLAHHRTYLLALPAIFLYLAYTFVKSGFSRQQILRSITIPVVLLVLLPALLYLSIWLRAAFGATSVDSSYTNAGFLDWILARQYAGAWLKLDTAHMGTQLSIWWRESLAQYGPVGLLGGLLGFVALLWRNSRIGLLTLEIYLCNLGFALLYTIDDVDVLFIPLHMVMAFWLAAALDLPRYLTVRSRSRLPARLAALPALAVCLMVVAGSGASIESHSPYNGLAVRDYGIDMLSQVAPNAVIIGIQGEMTLVRYLQTTAGLRPDVRTIAADSEQARMEALQRTVPAGAPVYLTRTLPGAPALYDLQSAGPLVRVLPQPPQAMPVLEAGTQTFDPPLHFSEPEHSAQPSLALMAYQVLAVAPSTETVPSADTPVRVHLLWRVEHTPEADYTVSLRLVAPDGTPAGQTDRQPLQGAYPTQAWRAGEYISDDYELRPNWGMPPADYSLVLTLYRSDGKSMLSNQHAFVTLGKLAVTRPQHYPPLSQIVPQGLSGGGWTWQPAGLQLLGLAGLNAIQPQELKAGDELPLQIWLKALRDTGSPTAQLVLTLKANEQSEAYTQTVPLAEQFRMGEILQKQVNLHLPRKGGQYSLSLCLQDEKGSACIPASPVSTLPILTGEQSERIPLPGIAITGRAYTTTPTEPAEKQTATIGTIARLYGYSYNAEQIRPGGTLSVTLEWQALAEPSESYKVFVQLLDAQGVLKAQSDSIPCSGACPTSAWIKGEYLLDSYTLALPADLTEGTYHIIIGMYDTKGRLPVTNASGQPDPEQKIALLKTIMVKR